MHHVPRYEAFTDQELRKIATGLTANGLVAMPVRVSREGGHWQKKPGYRDYLRCKPQTSGQIHQMHRLDPTHMGLVVPPGYIILDFDASRQEIEALISRLEAEWGLLPSTMWQETPSGGRHYLYRHPWGKGMRFSSRVHFQDGTKAPVDLLHCGYRFSVIYDPEFGQGDLHTIPLIPDGWRKAVAYRRPTAASESLPRLGHSVLTSDVQERLGDLRKARVRTRNETLHLLCFREMVRGAWSDRLETACLEAARECGLEDDEILSTMQSAAWAASEEWRWSLEWLSRVSSLMLPEAVFDTALLVAWKIVITGKTVIGLSVRELSELQGISVGSASAHLRSLVNAKVLVRTDQTQVDYACEYKPVIPTLDTLPVPKNAGRVFTYESLQRNLARVWLTRHRAFQRFGKGPVLNRGGARILEALDADSQKSISDLSEETRVGRSQVERRVRELRRAGLIEVIGGKVSLTASDAMAALDEWADRNGVPDRVRMREEMHAQQRLDRSKRLKELRRESGPAGG